MLREEEKLPPAILEFLELGLLKALPESGQLGIVGLLTHPAGLLHQILEGGHFGAELVELDSGRVLIDQLMAGSFIEVILVLLGVRELPLDGRQASGPLRRGKILEFFQQVLLFLEPPPDQELQTIFTHAYPSLISLVCLGNRPSFSPVMESRGCLLHATGVPKS